MQRIEKENWLNFKTCEVLHFLISSAIIKYENFKCMNGAYSMYHPHPDLFLFTCPIVLEDFPFCITLHIKNS